MLGEEVLDVFPSEGLHEGSVVGANRRLYDRLLLPLHL